MNRIIVRNIECEKNGPDCAKPCENKQETFASQNLKKNEESLL